MTSLLIGFLLVLVVPLFVASWRVSLLGLALQGGLLWAIAAQIEGADPTLHSLLTFVDLFLLRGIVAPGLLFVVLSARRAAERNDVLPPNLLAWAAAVGLVMFALRVAATLVPRSGSEQMMVAVAVSAVLLAFLVLATQAGVFSQILGALRLENALALFALSDGPREEGVAVLVTESLLLLVTLGFFRWYLDHHPPLAVPVPAGDDDDEFQDVHP